MDLITKVGVAFLVVPVHIKVIYWTTGWLDLMHYYIKAYKNGSYPTIHRDRVFLWARLYPANATAPDPVGRPANWEWVSTSAFLTF